MKLILLNGPPKCGKDTVGGLLKGPLNALTWKFAQPIIDHMQSTFGVSCADGADKDAPCDSLNGLSRRQYAIAWSEEWIKLKLGHGWFGKKAALELYNYYYPSESVVIFTDSGFSDEAREVIKFFGIDNVVHVKIHRPGYDFNGDSRSYWHIPDLRVVEFHNTCEMGELFNLVRSDLVPELLK